MSAQQLSIATTWLHIYSTRTYVCQPNVEYISIRAAPKGGYTCVTLTSCVLPQDGCATVAVTAVCHAFYKG